MTGNPKGSPWRNTPAEKRHRKYVKVYLDDATREKLERLAAARGGAGMRSAVVEELIMDAPEEKRRG